MGEQVIQDHKSDRLGTDSIAKLILRLSLPAVVAQLINVLYNIVDRMYIGRIEGIGDKALTGVGVTFPVLLLISAFSQLIGAGGAPLAAIQLGKGNRKQAERMLDCGFAVLLLLSVSLTIIFQVTKEPVLMAFGASEETIGYALEYLGIYLWGTIFVQLSLGLNQFIICQGKSTTAMLSVLIGAVTNIVLDPIFIFGFGLGVKGAAIATVISQFASALWVMLFLCSKKSGIRLSVKNMRIDFKILIPILALGVSPFIRQFTECLINIVFNSGLQKYGGDIYVGSMTIIQSVMQIITVTIQGFSQGVQPIISFNYGAGKFDRVRKSYRIGISFSVALAMFFCALVMLFPRLFASIFTNNQELIGVVVKMMPIFICGVGIFGLQLGCQSAFIGLGQAKISLFLACLRKIILLIPLALILPRFYGVAGIYVAEPISDIVSALTAGTLFFINIKKILSHEVLEKVS